MHPALTVKFYLEAVINGIHGGVPCYEERHPKLCIKSRQQYTIPRFSFAQNAHNLILNKSITQIRCSMGTITTDLVYTEIRVRIPPITLPVSSAQPDPHHTVPPQSSHRKHPYPGTHQPALDLLSAGDTHRHTHRTPACYCRLSS